MSYAWGEPTPAEPETPAPISAWFDAMNCRVVPSPGEAAERPEQTIRRLAQQVERLDRERAYYADQLMAVTTGLAPLCACDSCDCARSGYCTDGGPCKGDGREQGCPIHGDGVTFAAEVVALRALADAVSDHEADHLPVPVLDALNAWRRGGA